MTVGALYQINLPDTLEIDGETEDNGFDLKGEVPVIAGLSTVRIGLGTAGGGIGNTEHINHSGRHQVRENPIYSASSSVIFSKIDLTCSTFSN